MERRRLDPDQLRRRLRLLADRAQAKSVRLRRGADSRRCQPILQLGPHRRASS